MSEVENRTVKLLELELGMEAYIGPFCATRIPGGWIYQNAAGTVFVPQSSVQEDSEVQVIARRTLKERRRQGDVDEIEAFGRRMGNLTDGEEQR